MSRRRPGRWVGKILKDTCVLRQAKPSNGRRDDIDQRTLVGSTPLSDILCHDSFISIDIIKSLVSIYHKNVWQQWVIGEVLANPRKVDERLDTQTRKMSFVADARKLQNLRSAYGTGGKYDLFGCLDLCPRC